MMRGKCVTVSRGAERLYESLMRRREVLFFMKLRKVGQLNYGKLVLTRLPNMLIEFAPKAILKPRLCIPLNVTGIKV